MLPVIWSGKSSVLYALDAFYNASAQISEYDYFDKDTSTEIAIRITYGDLRDDKITEFSTYLSDNKLIVTKVINSGGQNSRRPGGGSETVLY